MKVWSSSHNSVLNLFLTPSHSAILPPYINKLPENPSSRDETTHYFDLSVFKELEDFGLSAN